MLSTSTFIKICKKKTLTKRHTLLCLKNKVFETKYKLYTYAFFCESKYKSYIFNTALCKLIS